MPNYFGNFAKTKAEIDSLRLTMTPIRFKFYTQLEHPIVDLPFQSYSILY
jgi:hypothetical protein